MAVRISVPDRCIPVSQKKPNSINIARFAEFNNHGIIRNWSEGIEHMFPLSRRLKDCYFYPVFDSEAREPQGRSHGQEGPRGFRLFLCTSEYAFRFEENCSVVREK